MSAINEILGQLPLDQLSEQLGVSQKEAKSASTQVITSLLGGMTANSQDSDGEFSLAQALVKHRNNGELFASDGVDLNGIDTKDGSKIVKHALGTTTSKTAAALSAKTGTDKSLLQKLLPILAPIVIAYIANKAFSNNAPVASSQDSNPLGSIVGGLLGGGSQQSSGDGLGSIVGGLLGGGSQQASASDGLGSIVGSILGGGQSSSGGLGGMLGNILGGAVGSEQASKTQKSSGGVLGGLLDAIF